MEKTFPALPASPLPADLPALSSSLVRELCAALNPPGTSRMCLLWFPILECRPLAKANSAAKPHPTGCRHTRLLTQGLGLLLTPLF